MGEIIAHSIRRFEVEIDLIRNGTESRSGRKTKSDVGLSHRKTRRHKRSQPVWPPSYSIRDVDYRKAGLATLMRRAKERFFFIFAVEELLDAMVGSDIQNKLNETLYDHEAGMSRGRLFVDDTGRIKHIPSLLFSLVNNTEVNRVRRCQICLNYFWAGRTDKAVCGERCGATSRKRTQRKNDLAIKRGNCVRKSSKGNHSNLEQRLANGAPVSRKGK